MRVYSRGGEGCDVARERGGVDNVDLCKRARMSANTDEIGGGDCQESPNEDTVPAEWMSIRALTAAATLKKSYTRDCELRLHDGS